MPLSIRDIVITISLSNFIPHPGHAKEQALEGVISSYECGDNCYLTIVDSEKKEHAGLCAAELCQQWNMDVAMPSKYKGMKVKVIVGKGLQYDGSGAVMDEMDVFTQIDILKQ
jgi:hypothetical protein